MLAQNKNPNREQKREYPASSLEKKSERSKEKMPIRGISSSALGTTGSFVTMKLRSSLNDSSFLPTLPTLSENPKHKKVAMMNRSLQNSRKTHASTKLDKSRTQKQVNISSIMEISEIPQIPTRNQFLQSEQLVLSMKDNMIKYSNDKVHNLDIQENQSPSRHIADSSLVNIQTVEEQMREQKYEITSTARNYF